MNCFRSPRVLARRTLQHLARPHPGVFHRREAAGVDRLGHQRAGHAQIERQLAHPLAGALRPGRVENHIDQVAVAVRIVLDAEDVAGDLDQVAVQLAFGTTAGRRRTVRRCSSPRAFLSIQ